MKKLYLCLFLLFFGINNLYGQIAKTLLGTVTTNVSGTYTTVSKPIAGYTWFRGHIVTDGGTGTPNQPVGYIEQSLNTASPLTWHGTNTITFSRSGQLWNGSINFAIIGQYAKLTVGNFGDATLMAVNWFVTSETSVNTTINVTSTSSGSSTSIVIGTTSTKLLETNTDRKYLITQNTGNNTFRISVENPATSSDLKITPDGHYERDAINSIYTGELHGITESGTTSVYVMEHN